MFIVDNPRAKLLAIVSYQDGMFVIHGFGTDKGVICLTADTTADVINKICEAYLEEQRRAKDD